MSSVVATDSALGHAVFLDRDGVINRACIREGKPFAPSTLNEFEILPGVSDACQRLKSAGYLIVIVTNQPEVGRGTIPQEEVERMHEKMCRLLPIDRVEVCYATGNEFPPSEFRKPRPGMLLRAADALRINLHRSWMIGDRWRDIGCGKAAGCRTIWIDCGYKEPMNITPDFTVGSLSQAAETSLHESRHTFQRAHEQLDPCGI